MAPDDREGPLTRLRREMKLPLPVERAEELARALSQRLGAPPPPEVRVTSVYFDQPDGRLAEAALSTPGRCLKVRTKEYDPDWGARGHPRCVVEIKRQRGPLTGKRRFWLPRDALAPLFSDRLDLLEGLGTKATAANAALACAGGAAGLAPVVAATYRRRIFQFSRGLRVTLDVELRFHRLTRDAALDPGPLRHQTLPPAFAAESRAIAEIKSLAPVLPEWAAELVRQTAAPEFSKFGAGLLLLGFTAPAERGGAAG